MSDTFPREIEQDEATAIALDTDAMLAELHELTGVLAVDEESPTREGVEEQPAGDEPVVGEHDDASDTAPSTPAVPPGYLEFEGRILPVEEVRALLALNERMKAEPEVAYRIHQAVTPTPTAPAAETIPDWVDQDDPFQVNMWREQQRTRAEAEAAQARLAAQSETERRAQVVDSFRAGMAEFRSQYPNLTDEQAAMVADLAGRAGILDGLERSEGSLKAAFVKGMDMTLWATPQLRSAVLGGTGATVPPNGKSEDRKVKAGALAPGGAPASKSATPERPKTREQLMDAMLADVRASMQE